ncbi:hypothetical protein D3C80_1808770 [compost metagenome]
MAIASARGALSFMVRIVPPLKMISPAGAAACCANAMPGEEQAKAEVAAAAPRYLRKSRLEAVDRRNATIPGLQAIHI